MGSYPQGTRAIVSRKKKKNKDVGLKVIVEKKKTKRDITKIIKEDQSVELIQESESTM